MSDARGAVHPHEHRRLDVVCIGNAIMDRLSFADLEVVAELGLASGSMTLIDLGFADRLAATLHPAREVSGGTSANTAVGVVSLGGRAAFVGAVAHDELGARYAADLRAAEVEVILEEVADEPGLPARTGHSNIIVTPDSERTMATFLGVSGRLDHDAIDADLVGSAAVVYFDGYSLDFPDAGRLVNTIVESAAAGETLLAFGLADPFVIERHVTEIAALISGPVAVLFANEAEALAFTRAGDVEGAIAALRRPGLVTVVTRGAKGAVLATDDELVTVSADHVEPVVDVTGAGDLFAAGVLFAVARGLGLEVAARLGALSAGEVIGHLGARPEQSLAALGAKAGLLARNLSR